MERTYEARFTVKIDGESLSTTLDFLGLEDILAEAPALDKAATLQSVVGALAVVEAHPVAVAIGVMDDLSPQSRESFSRIIALCHAYHEKPSDELAGIIDACLGNIAMQFAQFRKASETAELIAEGAHDQNN